MICELTGMDVANASMYDGASAAAEAAIMSAVQTKRNKILCSEGINPQTKDVLDTYLKFRGFEIEYLPLKNGGTDLELIQEKLDKTVASVIVQNPNFFGVIEELSGFAEKIHENKSLLIVSADPISLAILKKPADYGADIVVGEGQQLGGALAFGGPYLGFIACTEKLMRKMPGRIVGQSEDVDGKRAFVLTLQAREQHIRRYKATSNICSNQAHNALIACIYLVTMGKKGLKEVALQTLQKTNYLFTQMQKIEGYKPLFEGRKYFSEFPVICPGNVDEINFELLNEGFIGGFNIENEFPQYKNASLYCVTEKRTKIEMDELIQVLGGAKMKKYNKLIFEISQEDRKAWTLPALMLI
jgi:glycine dehydrogenase subunit 1